MNSQATQQRPPKTPETASMSWIDTHCHLDAAAFIHDRDQIVLAAHAAGVRQIIVPAISVKNFADVQTCCLRYAGCLAAYGIHPLYTAESEENDIHVLRHYLTAGQALAIGEIGLDYFVADTDHARQQHFFEAQLKLAQELALPVLLHARGAIEAVLQTLRRIPPPAGGIVHAFNGSLQQAKQFIALGFKLGFGGAVTWSRATRLRTLAATLPSESLVLETDAPDMAPQWIAHQRNEPALLPKIAATIADLRGLSLSDFATLQRNNVSALFSAMT